MTPSPPKKNLLPTLNKMAQCSAQNPEGPIHLLVVEFTVARKIHANWRYTGETGSQTTFVSFGSRLARPISEVTVQLQLLQFRRKWIYCNGKFNEKKGPSNPAGGPLNQSINQTPIAPISPAKPGSVAQHLNQCSTAKSRKQFRNINRPWGLTVSIGERPNQRDVSSDTSWR